MFFVDVLVARLPEASAAPPPEVDPMPDELDDPVISSLAQPADKRPKTVIIPIIFTDRVLIMNSSIIILNHNK
jgi:hypothetical protein